jgi:hypothetical protein
LVGYYHESAGLLLDRYHYWSWKAGNSHLRGLDWVKKPRGKKLENSIVMALSKPYADADSKAAYAVGIVER